MSVPATNNGFADPQRLRPPRFTGEDGVVHETHAGARLPIGAPDDGIALVEREGHELLWIDRLDELPAGRRAGPGRRPAASSSPKSGVLGVCPALPAPAPGKSTPIAALPGWC